MRFPFIVTILIGTAILFGCKQSATEAAAPQVKDTAPPVKVYPVESQLDKFEIRPNECAGELERLIKFKANQRDYFGSAKLYYDWSGDPKGGGAALNMSARDLNETAWWFQSLDLNDDGLCDVLATSFSGRSSVGQQFEIKLRKSTGHSLANDDKDFAYPPITNDSESKEYIADDDRFPLRLGGPMPLPGTDRDQTIVYRIHPKGGGAPYILVPGYDYTSDQQPDFKTWDNPGNLMNLYVFRWDPAIKKFREANFLLNGSFPDPDAPQAANEELWFGKTTAEYWSARAYIAERHLQDALKAFKTRDYTRASLLMGYANAADPRNPDIWGWYGALEYAGGRFKDAASKYYDAIDWTMARNLPVASILYFNRGLALEAVCWQQVQDRREGEKPGCDEDTHQSAVAAYEAHLKAAPNGKRAADARARLTDLARGVYREPQIDPEMARSSDAIDSMAKSLIQAQREMSMLAIDKEREQFEKEAEQQAKQAAKLKPAAVLDPETGQPVGAPTRDVFKLTPADLKTIDTEINRLLKQKGKTFVQSRIDWMIAYKAKFPAADLADMIERPEHYEALPWVQKWRQTYGELPR